ncbi:GntR family transcriptional regulator [Paenibacillus chondroitinus]|uniref:GntR family transcriptional regulator n=1 Tax=Paenibacillus chondroitinus TaxID=59842 RepID=A0ABU6D9T6_9BACL|nr:MULTISPECIES: GntR family transcriptional regulator [Paenibacillus]MCY9656848.1 GntR family transcriptional regulator [Paenibacillus anseongense]MEB4794498.1 GntR family transcriptional regulator [Paenibacillus chondroitinus]
MKIKPITSTTRDAVYQALKEQILMLDLLPGTGISEKEISVQFGVSRTPVRESFVQLSQEGLLDIYPQRGTVVSLIDLERVEEARFIREQLERAVISLACESFPADSLQQLRTNLAYQQVSMSEKDFKKMFELDEAFHRTIFEGCRKLNTWAIIQQVNVHLNRTRMLRLAADHRWDELYEQHEQMVDAIEHHEAGKAEQVMNTHLHLTVTDQTVLKEKFPTYFK